MLRCEVCITPMLADYANWLLPPGCCLSLCALNRATAGLWWCAEGRLLCVQPPSSTFLTARCNLAATQSMWMILTRLTMQRFTSCLCSLETSSLQVGRVISWLESQSGDDDAACVSQQVSCTACNVVCVFWCTLDDPTCAYQQQHRLNSKKTQKDSVSVSCQLLVV